ncbi:MAG: hypothetical protein ACYDG2_12005 [Ruminiclostridium sp.]
MKLKILVGMGALISCLVISSIGVFAQSPVTFYIGTYVCRGSVSMGTDSASATTTSSISSSACSTTVTYKYGFGTSAFVVSNTNTYPSTSVSAVVEADHYSVRNLGAMGEHSVYSNVGDNSGVSTVGQSIY